MLFPIIEKEVKKLLDAKIIILLRYSEWVANIVHLRKKNGEIRLCVDLRNMNKCSMKENYPFPKMDHIMLKVVGAQRISMLYGYPKYNHISIFEEDKKKNSLTTPWFDEHMGYFLEGHGHHIRRRKRQIHGHLS